MRPGTLGIKITRICVLAVTSPPSKASAMNTPGNSGVFFYGSKDIRQAYYFAANRW